MIKARAKLRTAKIKDSLFIVPPMRHESLAPDLPLKRLAQRRASRGLTSADACPGVCRFVTGPEGLRERIDGSRRL